MNKKEILKMAEIVNKINELYDIKNRYISRMFDKYGECSHFIDTKEGDKPFLRVEIVDNMAKIAANNTVYKSTGFNRLDAVVSYLKHLPKPKV